MASAPIPGRTIPLQTVDLSVPSPKRATHLSLPLYQGCEYNPEHKAWEIAASEGFMKFNLEIPCAQSIRLTLDVASLPGTGTSDNPCTITVNEYTLVRGFDDHETIFHQVVYMLTAQWLREGNNSIRIQLDKDARTHVLFRSVGVEGV